MFNFYDEERHQKANSFAWLLIAQLFLIIMPAIFEYLHMPWIAGLGVVFVMLSSLYIATTTKKDLIRGLAIMSVVVILIFIDASHSAELPDAPFSHRALAFVTIILVIFFFLYIGVKLVQQVQKIGEISVNTVMAAITGYLLIGITGGELVRLVQLLGPGSFNIEAAADRYTYMYFSFVTITTLGYGDITPQEPIAQGLVVLLATAGQMYLTIVIAMIVGQLISNKR
jgi:voltage-gated potassium channel